MIRITLLLLMVSLCSHGQSIKAEADSTIKLNFITHNNRILFIVAKNPIIRFDQNGDLYFNPRLLLKSEYLPDTLILWGNIYH
jgi:hypothetical protein